MAQVKDRVLIHTLIFPPDQVSTSYLYGDIVQKLIKEGYSVIVLTTSPHYNYTEDFSKHSKTGLVWRKSNYYGARVFHFPQKKSRSFFVRGGYILFFHLAAFFKGLFLPKFDFIITPSPPLTSGLVAGILAKLRGAKAIYNVQEIYPDVFIKQGAVRSHLLISAFKWLEKITYRLSDKVVTIDEHFSDTIRQRMSAEKLVCIPNFIDTDLYKPYDGKTSESLEFGGKYIIGYVGNLGRVQDWDAIAGAAALLSNDEKFHFLLIGGGSEFQKLKALEKDHGNLSVWPYQNRDRIPEINSRINLHIISMNEASDYDGLPSKVFAILASGRPILAATNADTPLAKLLKESGNGVIVPRSDSRAIADAIKRIANGALPADSNEVGRRFVINGYSKEVVTSKYVQLLKELQ